MKAASLPVFALALGLFAGCRPSPPAVAGPGQCVTCHADETGFSAFHDAEVIGCASCHQGDPAADSQVKAHAGLIVVPGNLGTAATSCGQAGCHPEWVSRVEGSLMATGRGIVSVDRWVFGEAASPEGKDGFQNLGNSPADSHLRQLCMSCHLGTEKPEPGPLTTLSRGGGCLACHLSYPDPSAHAQLTLKVPDARCEGCHSRSGRISLNYAGWHETTLDSALAGPGMRLLADGRVVSPQPEDVHHAAGMACLDCHTAYELMGDGQLYTHQEQATEVTCVTCHKASPDLAWGEAPPEAVKLAVMRAGAPAKGRLFARSEISGRAVTNLFRDPGGDVVLQSKLDGALRPVPAPAQACAREGHERVSCQSCHTAWVPQCLGCHTERLVDGTWVELIDEFRAEPPPLGVRTFRDSSGSIEPFVPGMIMTLAVSAHREPAPRAGSGSFHRLYAPAVPHTTSAAGRSCQSCHQDPLAMGFGRGQLDLQADGAWRFTPQFAPLRDGLPADAWIPFPAGTGKSTRLDARPLDAGELERVLRVGACLTCHAEDQASVFADFAAALEHLTPACQTGFLEPWN